MGNRETEVLLDQRKVARPLVYATLLVMVVMHGCFGSVLSLSNAITNQDQDTVGRLLHRGEDVNARDSAGWTPLMLAASLGHVRIAQMLLDYGADPTITDRFGETALSIAQSRDNTLIVELLERHEAGTKTTH